MRHAHTPIRIGDAGAAIAALQSQYQALSPFSLTNPNPNYLANFVTGGVNFPLGLFAPDYKTPRSTQINVGIQHELSPGVVSVWTTFATSPPACCLGLTENHTGDAPVLQRSRSMNRHRSNDRPVRLRRRHQRRGYQLRDCRGSDHHLLCQQTASTRKAIWAAPALRRDAPLAV